MAHQTLQVEKSTAGLLHITLHRPDSRNALNTQMGIELREIFAPLAFHPQDVRCVLITGSGDKAFCAGGDLKERNGMSDDQWRVHERDLRLTCVGSCVEFFTPFLFNRDTGRSTCQRPPPT